MTRASARECEEKESMRNIFHNCLPLHDARSELSNVVFLLRHPRSIDLDPGKWNCSEVLRRTKEDLDRPQDPRSILAIPTNWNVSQSQKPALAAGKSL